MRRPMTRSLLVVVIGLSPALLHAQGSLGTQGYGYPGGQLSSAALGIGGATAELDAASPINPATLATPLRYSIYLQFEPEFRRTTVGDASTTSTNIRFPLFMATGSFRRFSAGVSTSTLLDRTWSNVYPDSQVVGGETFPSTITAASTGSMNDVRFALAYSFGRRAQVGVATHAITGQNRMRFGRSFPDSTGLGAVTQLSTIGFSGRATSAGAVVVPVPGLVLAASARFGGSLTADQDDTRFAEASVPSRYGVGVSWFGIPNTTLSARYERTLWSDMDELGTAQLTTFDATEVGLGLDVLGPRIGGAASTVRIGVRDRGLPFGWNGLQVNERAYTGGVSIPVSRGRAALDLTLQRALRTAGAVEERSWFIGVGLGIRP
jgi:hypothetical protein